MRNTATMEIQEAACTLEIHYRVQKKDWTYTSIVWTWLVLSLLIYSIHHQIQLVYNLPENKTLPQPSLTVTIIAAEGKVKGLLPCPQLMVVRRLDQKNIQV